MSLPVRTRESTDMVQFDFREVVEEIHRGQPLGATGGCASHQDASSSGVAGTSLSAQRILRGGDATAVRHSNNAAFSKLNQRTASQAHSATTVIARVTCRHGCCKKDNRRVSPQRAPEQPFSAQLGLVSLKRCWRSSVGACPIQLQGIGHSTANSTSTSAAYSPATRSRRSIQQFKAERRHRHQLLCGFCFAPGRKRGQSKRIPLW
jgi:hypothetical protein